jgi:hypothetical protein
MPNPPTCPGGSKSLLSSLITIRYVRSYSFMTPTSTTILLYSRSIGQYRTVCMNPRDAVCGGLESPVQGTIVSPEHGGPYHRPSSCSCTNARRSVGIANCASFRPQPASVGGAMSLAGREDTNHQIVAIKKYATSPLPRSIGYTGVHLAGAARRQGALPPGKIALQHQMGLDIRRHLFYSTD